MKLIQCILILCQFIHVQLVLVSTPSGNIRGFSSNNLNVFLGIRYGSFGERWTKASLPSSWNNIQDATAFGPICHQFGPYNIPFLHNETEQCLFLNIWAPTVSNGTQLPVRVWIHGGGYTAGSSNDYDATNLARISNSIIVTINYRLGIFGFFPLPGIQERNIGWSDQQLAFQWVQENIASFGGDKSNVMIFGQSAGGGSVLTHLLTPSSWPLYSSCVIQSPGPFVYAYCDHSEKDNFKYLQTAFPQCQDDLNCFRQLNASVLYGNSTLNWVTLWPCVGNGSQLAEQPVSLFRQGKYNQQVPIMGGMNFNEGQTSILTFNGFQMSVNLTQYYEMSRSYFIPNELIEAYDPTTTDKDYFTALAWLFNDYFLQCPFSLVFNHFANWTTPVNGYFFTHPTENWIFSPFHFNATHLTEIPYVFQNNFVGAQLTAAEFNLSSTIIDYYGRFQKGEKPWPVYGANQTVIIFDTTKDGQLKTRAGFSDRLIEKCPPMLKYFDNGSSQIKGIVSVFLPVLSLFNKKYN